MPFSFQQSGPFERPIKKTLNFAKFIDKFFKKPEFNQNDLTIADLVLEYSRREKDKMNNVFNLENYKLFSELIKQIFNLPYYKDSVDELIKYVDNEDGLKIYLLEFDEFRIEGSNEALAFSVNDFLVVIKHFIKSSNHFDSNES